MRLFFNLIVSLDFFFSLLDSALPDVSEISTGKKNQIYEPSFSINDNGSEKYFSAKIKYIDMNVYSVNKSAPGKKT